MSEQQRVSAVFYIEKPRYSGEHWRVVVRSGALVTNKGFTSEEAAIAFAKEKKHA